MIVESLKTILRNNYFKNDSIFMENDIFRVCFIKQTLYHKNYCWYPKFVITLNWNTYDYLGGKLIRLPEDKKKAVNYCFVLFKNRITCSVEIVNRGDIIKYRRISIAKFMKRLGRHFDLEEIDIKLQEQIISYL